MLAIAAKMESLMQHDGWQFLMSEVDAEMANILGRLAQDEFESLAHVARLQGKIEGLKFAQEHLQYHLSQAAKVLQEEAKRDVRAH